MGSKVKKFNAGDLSKKPSEVFEAARTEGAIIQHKNRQGKVVEEFVMVTRELMFDTVDTCSLADGSSGDNKQTELWNATQPNLDYSE